MENKKPEVEISYGAITVDLSGDIPVIPKELGMDGRSGYRTPR